MISRKVRKSGNGLVVGMPKKVLEDLNVKEGMSIQFIKKENGYQITTAHDNDEEILDLAREISQKYKTVFEKLVER